jgi:hypothetical protein
LGLGSRSGLGLGLGLGTPLEVSALARRPGVHEGQVLSEQGVEALE